MTQTSRSVPEVPPAEWFDDPHLDGPTALVVEPSGRVYGHLALWDTCHTGFPGCVTPPHSASGYAFFNLGEIRCAGGKSIPCGQITVETNHSELRLAWQDAKAHYAHTGAAVADVRAGEDRHGIWLAGALRPDVSPSTLRKLRGSKLSGDWRWVRGVPEMIGALGTNIPGFPVPRPRALMASGEQVSLVAAGICNEPCLCQIASLLEEIAS